MRTLLWMQMVMLLTLAASAEDWPMYMHDPARSGVSGEALVLPLAKLWTYTPPAEPTPAWPDLPLSERPKLTFDDATHVALAGDAVYFGSAVDNGIHALDAATGARRWTVFTDGPVRLAPTFAPTAAADKAGGKPTVTEGRVFAGSDDGVAYCLETQSGRVVWRTRLIPGPTRILGAGRVMSLWPVRTDVLLDEGVAYCGAGLFPAQGTTLMALNIKTGQMLWQAAQSSKTNQVPSQIPEGYLLASANQIYVPRGRAPPLCFARADGAYLGSPESVPGFKGVVSGDYGVLVGEHYYFGTQGSLYGAEPDGKRVAVWNETRQLVATSNRFFRLVNASGKGAWRERTWVIAINRATYDPVTKQAIADTDMAWRYAGTNLEVIIVAGPHIVAGGSNEVVVLDATTGKPVWRSRVDGLVKGLAVANGRLVASTDNGRLHCFGRGTTVARMVPPAQPLPADAAVPGSQNASALAEAIAKDLALKRGYGLVIGSGDARLALELAKRTGLLVHVLETDPVKAATARTALAALGAYGVKVVVDLMPTDAANSLPYPSYFANVVVVAGNAPGQGAVTAKELLRLVKPCGGVLYAWGMTPDAAWKSAGTATQVALAGMGGWTKLVRGRLSEAEWTHQYADAGNTGSSDDALVKGRLEVLWYGEPGPAKMQERHRRSQAPLFMNGRIYVEGLRMPDERPIIMCFDAYNGVPYWEREVPGAVRLTVMADCGNLAASPAGLFVAVDGQCLQLDAVTGATRRTFALPTRSDGSSGSWAFVAVVGDTLLGSSSPAYQFSDEVFAYDLVTGALKWRHKASVLRNSTLAVSGGRVFFAEQRGAVKAPHVLNYNEQVRQNQAKRRGESIEVEKPKAEASYRRTAVALDLATGKELWAREVDLTDCGSWNDSLSAAVKHDVLVFYGAYLAYGRAKGDENKRRVLALSAKDGSVLWNKPFGNFVRPVIVNDQLISRPNAVLLKTGEPMLSTGLKRTQPWRIPALGACGQMSASSSLLFYRLGYLWVMDIETAKANMRFIGMRPGCLINTIPAGGIVTMVEASSGCVCAHAALQSTVVFAPVGMD
ncbi:MAG: PQQ-binding-like beta-propeller repeat protein [Lentisphaerae bacterium]|nr:PQQ-binding-like beta-propeller repeat protein [Lentisphaerota bacterium]